MTFRESSEPVAAESDVVRWDQILTGKRPTLELVSAFAGDRPLTESEQTYLGELQHERGAYFYQDLLYTVTHHVFPVATAAELWREILRHKYEMSAALCRNARITVAALDFLANLKGTLHAATVIGEDHVNAMLRHALRDSLTGLFNHASFFQKLAQELDCHAHCQKQVAVMMLDVDDFKRINDTHGHHAGDQVLVELAALLKGTVRTNDICCRYGGEEFAIILPASDAPEAGQLAKRLCDHIRNSRPAGRGITVSVGVAASHAGAISAKLLAEQADAALYRAKSTGKDRVVIAPL